MKKFKQYITENESYFKDSKIRNDKGNLLTVYHGSSVEFDEFDPERAVGTQYWFTSDLDSIKEGRSGAISSKVIMAFHLNITNPAGWDEYDKLFIDQIIDQGYDGLILDDVFVIFNPNQAKKLGRVV